MALARTLDDFLARVKTDPASALREDELDSFTLAFRENQAGAAEAVRQLVLPVHTLGILELLLALDDQRAPDWPEQTRTFLLQCDPVLVIKAKRRYISLASRFATLCIKNGAAARAAAPLKRCIQNLQASSPAHVTSLHGIFTQVCLLARFYSIAQPILDIDCFHVETFGNQAADIDTRNVLLYYYYGGMLYIGLKKYKRALEFFAIVVQAPGELLSAISVAAYKKYVLLALIVWGALPSSARSSSASSAWSQFSAPHARIYKTLADRFVKLSPSAFGKFVEENAVQFFEDGNMGLVKQCQSSLVRHRIKRLTETFITLSLADIAKRVDIKDAAEVERHIVDMVANREIFASINDSTGMVSFRDDPEQYDDEETMVKLLEHLENARQIFDKISETDTTIRTDPVFIRKSVFSEQAVAAAGDDAVDMDVEMFLT